MKKIFKRIFFSIRARTKRRLNQCRLSFVDWRYKNENRIVQVDIDNLHFCVSAADNGGKVLIGLKQFEARDTKFIRSIAKENWVCVDIGANIGYWSIILADRCPNGTIYAFEPSPFPHALLQLNILLNAYKNVNIFQTALSDVEGLTTFTVSKDTGFSSFQDTRRKGIDKQIEVICTSLDTTMTKYASPYIHFIKIDVEGAELLVLQGSTNLFASGRIGLCMIELNEQNLAAYNVTIANIVTFFDTYSYKPFVLDTSEKTLRPAEKIDFGRIENVYFQR